MNVGIFSVPLRQNYEKIIIASWKIVPKLESEAYCGIHTGKLWNCVDVYLVVQRLASHSSTYGNWVLVNKGDKCLHFPVCFPVQLGLSEKGFTLREKTNAPLESKDFPFRADPFQKGGKQLWHMSYRMTTQPPPLLAPPPPPPQKKKMSKCHVYPAKTQISLINHPVLSESLLSARKKLSTERTAKFLIRLVGCPGGSEPSLGAHPFCWFVMRGLIFTSTKSVSIIFNAPSYVIIERQ